MYLSNDTAYFRWRTIRHQGQLAYIVRTILSMSLLLLLAAPLLFCRELSWESIREMFQPEIIIGYLLGGIVLGTLRGLRKWHEFKERARDETEGPAFPTAISQQPVVQSYDEQLQTSWESLQRMGQVKFVFSTGLQFAAIAFAILTVLELFDHGFSLAVLKQFFNPGVTAWRFGLLLAVGTLLAWRDWRFFERAQVADL